MQYALVKSRLSYIDVDPILWTVWGTSYSYFFVCLKNEKSVTKLALAFRVLEVSSVEMTSSEKGSVVIFHRGRAAVKGLS